MKISDILEQIELTAKKNRISRIFVCGGIPRDRVRGISKEIRDLDLTTEGGDAIKLAYALTDVLPYKFFKVFDDGHAAIDLNGLKIDFSNHFIINNIDTELNRLNIKKPTRLAKEMYSRDFTINTLLQDLDFKTIYDVTGVGVSDIKSKIIKTPIDPNITIKSDPKRIFRALNFAIRFDYEIDSGLKNAIKSNRNLLTNLSKEYCKDKANEIVKADNKRGLTMLIELGLLNVIPQTKYISDVLIDNKLLYYVYGDKNKK